ncbi:SH3 domain-containing protein [uncultured Kordia sp.]|uniref:SH3 domain-containing protein n=1 Tax=uncultured Kordia sp. TaxID=507699 RepID=UPI00260BCA49|nr:SH3 domain-containing protein [uncultured Kordia sp.]
MLCITVLMISCGSDSKEKSKTSTETVPEEVKKTEEAPKVDNSYYAWVDNINVRDAANTKGKVVGTYTSEDALEFTGTKSDTKEIIVLRGVAYDDYWMKVTTKDNKEGWVYGGAVQQKGDEKGNGIITDKQFDFAHFGKFDISSWTDLGITKSESGDAETVNYSYLKDNQIIEIERTEVGEHGYYYTFKLMDAKRNLQKERKFSYTVEMGDSSPKMELTETVKDYTAKKEYTRSQSIKKHFMQLNAKPEMVNGAWKETTLQETTSATEEIAPAVEESALDKKTSFARPMQIITSINSLPDEFRDGCSCSFRTHPDDYDTLLVMGTYEDAPKAKAIIKINGKNVILKSKKPENPDPKKGDHFRHYYNDQYDLKFSLTKDGQNDGGGPEYTGTMHLTSKDGKVNTDINIFGGCGC